MKEYLQKALQDNISRNHIFLCLLVILLTLTPLLGLGFKNSILSSLFIIFYLINLNPKFKYPKSIPTKLIFIFLVLFTVSMFFRQTPYGFHEFINLGLGCLVTLNFLNKPIQTQKFSKFLLVLTSLVSVLSIALLYYTGADRGFGTFFGADPYTYYPNAFSNLLLVSVTLGANLFLNSKIKNLKQEKLLLVSLFLSLLGFWTTFSRGAYLSLALAMIFLVIMHFFRNKKDWKDSVKKYIILLVIALTALLSGTLLSVSANYGSDFTDRIQTSDISSIKSATERPLLWDGAIQIFKDNPLTGSGSGSFQFIYPKYQGQLLSNAPHPHNLMLKLLSENGLIVTAVFVLLLLLTLKPKNFLNKPEYLAAFGGLNLQFILDYNMNFPIISFLYFFLMAYLLSENDLTKSQKSKHTKALGFIFTSIFIVAIITQGYGYYYIKQIENNPDSPDYYVSLAKIAPFEHQLYSQIDNPIQTNKYPDFHPSLYVQALNTKQISLIEKALDLNYYNDLAYHLLHSELLLLQAEQNLETVDDSYYSLVEDYIQLLSVNTHNTITSKNPQNAYKIIQLFTPLSENNWLKLENQLDSVYKTEKNKFQTRFNYNLPDLNA